MSTSRSTLALWRMDDSAYDPEGTTLAHMFGLCEVLTLAGEEVPAELEFRPSPLGHSEEDLEQLWPDSEYLADMDAGTLTPDEARRALRILHRYLAFVRKVHS